MSHPNTAADVQEAIPYPTTRRSQHVDTYHGVEIPDPYRWLEDDRSAETSAWVVEQNRLTEAYLERIPFRKTLHDRVESLLNYPRYSVPFHRGDLHFFFRNEGLQNQAVLYFHRGLDETPEVLIDPNTFSQDGTARLTVFEASKDGRYAAYGVSYGGSDWQEWRVMDLTTRQTLEDRLEWVKFCGPAWRGNGFYYSRYPVPDGSELSQRNENHWVYYHEIGTLQSEDVLVFSDVEHPLRMHFVGTSEDERFEFLTISDSDSGRQGNALFYRDASKGEMEFRAIVGEIGDSSFDVLESDGAHIYIKTDLDAPRGRVVRYDTEAPAGERWQEIVPQKAETLSQATIAAGRIFLHYLHDVAARAYVHRLDGSFDHEIELPGLGTIGGISGERNDSAVYYLFTSYEVPSTIYRYDVELRTSTVHRAPELAGYDPSEYETRREFYTSKDGTRIPLFLVHKRGLKLDGNNPVMLHGYGGFRIPILPAFSAARIALLEMGVVVANACLRGGGEYGEEWHEAGTKLQKQNVFDDFVAAAVYLIESGVTRPEKLGIVGGSNGGLLVGAVTNQRPDLFRVAIPQVGVLDMLRFHRFTIGSAWIPDYGSSDDPEEFRALLAYSPLHNIRDDVEYPATMIMTADHDDRVVPAHSFKYAATLQERHCGRNPTLIRIDTQSGHGSSSVRKSIDDLTDEYAFALYNLGV